MKNAIRHELCKLIEEKFESEVRNFKDVLRLSIEIRRTTQKEISVSTLNRLFNRNPHQAETNQPVKPRLKTLDILSQYLGYKNWDELGPKTSKTVKK